MSNPLAQIFEKMKYFFSDMRVQYKLVLINLLTVVIPVLFIYIFTFTTYINSLSEQLVSSEFRSLSQVALSLESYISELGSLGQSYATDRSLAAVLRSGPDRDNMQSALRNSAAALGAMKNALSTHDELLGCFLFGQNGNRYKLTCGNVLKPIDDFAQDDWYEAARRTPDVNMLFSENLLDEYIEYDRRALTFMRGVTDYMTGEFLGAVLYSIDMSKIAGLAVSTASTRHSVMIVADASGRIYYHTDPAMIGKTIISFEFVNNVVFPREGYYVHNEHSTAPVAVFSTTSEVDGFKIIELLPLNEFFSPIAEARVFTSALMVLCMALLALVTLLMSSGITRPLRDLTVELEQFENSGKIAEKRSNNEISRLKDSFEDMKQRINMLITNVYAAQLKQKEAELSALQSKINPHFLYNTLEMIASMAEEYGVPPVSRATRNLGKILQYSLRFENEFVTVREEIASVRCYMAIQQMRFDDRFHVVFDLPPEVLDRRILKLVIQPLIENSIYHGLEPKIGSGTVLITGNITADGAMTITIADNGVGIPDSDMAIIQSSLTEGVNGFSGANRSLTNRNRGFALMNINSRIKLRYGESSSMTITSVPGSGATVTLYISGGSESQ